MVFPYQENRFPFPPAFLRNSLQTNLSLLRDRCCLPSKSAISGVEKSHQLGATFASAEQNGSCNSLYAQLSDSDFLALSRTGEVTRSIKLDGCRPAHFWNAEFSLTCREMEAIGVTVQPKGSTIV